MRIRPSLPFANFSRGYATRRPVKPPPKFPDPLTNDSHSTVQTLPDGLTLIHRPPPTAPSVFSTTVLPASPLLRPSSSSSRLPDAPSPINTAEPDVGSASSSIPVPPRLRRLREFSSNRVLTEADFAEMRELRASNPSFYTRTRLAKRFNCPPFLVAQQVPLDKKSKAVAIEKTEKEHGEIRSKWGERKEMVRAIRQKRREFW